MKKKLGQHNPILDGKTGKKIKAMKKIGSIGLT